MSETVYIFGAGINRSLINHRGITPPLATDLFKLYFKEHPTDAIGEGYYRKPLFDYIEQYWKLSFEDLKTESFDLEECFTMLETQQCEAERNGQEAVFRRLSEVKKCLTELLRNQIDSASMGSSWSDVNFAALGKVIWKEKATVLTFNYDTLIEEAIERASGPTVGVPGIVDHDRWSRLHADGEAEGRFHADRPSDVSEELLGFRRNRWNRCAAYCHLFDELRSSWGGPPVLLDGKEYFGMPCNQPERPHVLKLHGSLNWRRCVGHVPVRGREANPPRRIQRGQTFLGDSHLIADHLFEPIIITPVLFKNIDGDSMLAKTWRRAQDELKDCKRLIIGGYSFPPTDFYAKKLLREAFAHRSPEEVILINPCKKLVEKVKGLVHVEPNRYQNLEHFIDQYWGHSRLLTPQEERFTNLMRKGSKQ